MVAPLVSGAIGAGVGLAAGLVYSFVAVPLITGHRPTAKGTLAVLAGFTAGGFVAGASFGFLSGPAVATVVGSAKVALALAGGTAAITGGATGSTVTKATMNVETHRPVTEGTGKAALVGASGGGAAAAVAITGGLLIPASVSTVTAGVLIGAVAGPTGNYVGNGTQNALDGRPWNEHAGKAVLAGEIVGPIGGAIGGRLAALPVRETPPPPPNEPPEVPNATGFTEALDGKHGSVTPAEAPPAVPAARVEADAAIQGALKSLADRNQRFMDNLWNRQRDGGRIGDGNWYSRYSHDIPKVESAVESYYRDLPSYAAEASRAGVGRDSFVKSGLSDLQNIMSRGASPAAPATEDAEALGKIYDANAVARTLPKNSSGAEASAYFKAAADAQRGNSRYMEYGEIEDTIYAGARRLGLDPFKDFNRTALWDMVCSIGRGLRQGDGSAVNGIDQASRNALNPGVDPVRVQQFQAGVKDYVSSLSAR
jgi:hypothetical protein